MEVQGTNIFIQRFVELNNEYHDDIKSHFMFSISLFDNNLYFSGQS